MLEAATTLKDWLKMNLGITLSDSLFTQGLESTNCAWTYLDLPANGTEKVRVSNSGVCVITQANCV